jgi:hypothetical protein
LSEAAARGCTGDGVAFAGDVIHSKVDVMVDEEIDGELKQNVVLVTCSHRVEDFNCVRFIRIYRYTVKCRTESGSIVESAADSIGFKEDGVGLRRCGQG